jgi:hypothetical protein
MATVRLMKSMPLQQKINLDLKDGPLPLSVWRTRQGIGLSHRGNLGLAPPGYDLPSLRGSREEL